ncbi:MAG: PRC-barrel domain-containing protein [Afipia sp.]|nr:PRC-barrel domain-containing protein [Afipia sp.]
MIAKYLAAAMFGTALVSGAALAQTANTSTSPSASAISTAQDVKGSWRASKLVGLNVYNDGNEKVGDINEVLLDNSGKVSAVILGVGGFLGVGEQNVAVNFDQLKWVDAPVKTSSASGTAPMGAPASSTTTTGSASAINSGSMGAAHDNWYPDHAVISATKDQLKAMPAFKYSDYKK